MRSATRLWNRAEGWTCAAEEEVAEPQLVLVFGSRGALEDPTAVDELRSAYPGACFIGCSTAGEIVGTGVLDDHISATAIRFETTGVRTVSARVHSAEESATVAERLAAELVGEDLVHVFVLAEGLRINGSALAAGMRRALPPNVAVTGGLAGDGSAFERTLVVTDQCVGEGLVAMVGFYGTRLRVGYGSMGGWDPFGPERIVTRSHANTLYELDDEPALDLYKRYLGEWADGLPATGLRFPLSLRTEAGDDPVVRTILGVDEGDGSLVFAGDVPVGAIVRLMKANVDRLIDGASGAATTCRRPIDDPDPDLAILISCVGRRLVLQQRVEEEVESVRDAFGPRTVLTGFYSYGELAPFRASARCELHNQTMTITTLSEG